MVRPIVPRQPVAPVAGGGRDRAASNSGRPIQVGTSHRASINMSSIIGAQARSALPPEVPLKPVNARDSAASVEEPPADSGGIFGSLGKALSGRLSFASAEPEPVPLKEPVAAAPPPAEEAAKEEAPARTSFLESAGSVLAYPFSGGSSSAAPATEPLPPPQVEQQTVEPPRPHAGRRTLLRAGVEEVEAA